MTNFRELLDDPKEREDIIIGIVVLFLFLGPTLYFIYGKNTSPLESTLRTEETNESTNSVVTTAVSIATIENSISEDEEVIIEEAPKNNKLNAWIDSLENNNISNSLSKLNLSLENSLANLSDNEKIIELKDTLSPVVKNNEREIAELRELPTEKIEVEGSISNTDFKVDTSKSRKAQANEHPNISEEKVIKNSAAIPLEKSNPPKSSTTNARKSAYDCFVVLGAFKEFSNSQNLIRQLKKKKYPIYRGRQRGYHIVGVNCKCNQSHSILSTLKKEFNREAFIVNRE